MKHLEAFSAQVHELDPLNSLLQENNHGSKSQYLSKKKKKKKPPFLFFPHRGPETLGKIICVTIPLLVNCSFRETTPSSNKFAFKQVICKGKGLPIPPHTLLSNYRFERAGLIGVTQLFSHSVLLLLTPLGFL